MVVSKRDSLRYEIGIGYTKIKQVRKFQYPGSILEGYE